MVSTLSCKLRKTVGQCFSITKEPFQLFCWQCVMLTTGYFKTP